ncbi:MAG TPA: TRAP transporter large permease subunit, partial [Burkholderiaceae bacterium]|nr:TRAP transporter large permease subunit [Burkholderiaceae bacterium]
MLPPFDEIRDGHIGLLMLGMIVITIMLGFPTAFTLMGMGVGFSFYAYRNMGLGAAWEQTLDLMVLRAYAVMTNDVLIAVPLFIFMGYLIERANLIERLFKTLHMAMARVPGSLAVASIATCAIFATATGIVGAVVTLMGLLAFPVMLNAGYSTRLAAGAITAGGCLGILIPPSIMLIVYGAVAGVSVVKLYAGAFFPGIMLSGLYIAYIIVISKLRPQSAPPLPAEERILPLTAATEHISRTFSKRAVPSLARAVLSRGKAGVERNHAFRNLALALLPLFIFILAVGTSYDYLTQPAPAEQDYSALSFDSGDDELAALLSGGALDEPEGAASLDATEDDALAAEAAEVAEAALERQPAPSLFWWVAGIASALVFAAYALFTFQQLELFKLMITSFFPLAILILAVLGSIIFGFAT